jgi:hypothetical protein
MIRESMGGKKKAGRASEAASFAASWPSTRDVPALDLGVSPVKSRPTIFLSGVSREFAAFRDAAEVELQRKECFAVNQSSFAPDHRTVEAMLTRRLADSDAVIHLVGYRFGAEPNERPADAPRRSYTQMEFRRRPEAEQAGLRSCRARPSCASRPRPTSRPRTTRPVIKGVTDGPYPATEGRSAERGRLALKAAGRLTESLELTRASLQKAIEQGSGRGAAVAAGSASELDLMLGDLNAAIESARQGVAYADHSNPGSAADHAVERSDARARLADVLSQAGRRLAPLH